jgi:putative membrane-bound dehydrogenase-like protein
MPRFVLLLCLLTASPLFAQLPPDEALKTFTVAPGLKLELFASEPLFTNPTCMDIDEKGRVWVCESVNYRYKLMKKKMNRAEGDRIVILHDSDGDGKADKATTFYQSPDLLAPLGIAVARNATGPGYKVYVCHSPHLYLFEDADGDGKADGPPTVLLTGFGGFDHDHGIHGIHFGPDGKLYFSVGDQGVKNLQGRAPSKDGKLGELTGKVFNTNRVDCQAGTMWRCNTDGSALELLAHNFRNQYEPAVNSFGTMFASDNDDDGNQQTRMCHVMYGGDYGYWPRNRGDHHWHEDLPGVVHKTLRTGFGSPTGLCWYEGKMLHGAFSAQLAVSSQLSAVSKTNHKTGVVGNPGPHSYEGYLLHTDAGPRELRLFGVRPKGAGYELDKVNLVTSSDNWFRPSDVCVAPDGSVFIADWYDPGVGGHGMGDTKRGRIYRLTTSKGEKYDPLNNKECALSGSLAGVDSPNIAKRQQVLQRLHESIEKGPDEPIVRKIYDDLRHGQFERSSDHARCLWLSILLVSLGDPTGMEDGWCHLPEKFNNNIDRQLVIRLRRQMWGVPSIKPMFILNYDPAIIREVLVGFRDLESKKFIDTFWDCAERFDGHDRTYLAALNIACGTEPQRRNAILNDFEKHFPEWNDKTAWLVWELRPPKVIAKLGHKLATEPMSPLQTELALGAMAAASGSDGGESMLKLLSTTQLNRQVRGAAITTLLKYLPGKWASLKNSDLVRRAIETQMKDGVMLPAVIELVAVCERKDFEGFLGTLASGVEGHPNSVRFTAIAGLSKLKGKDSVTLLSKLLNRPEPKAARQEVMKALGKMNTEEALMPLQKVFGDSKLDGEDRRMALEALAGSRLGTTWLLNQHQNAQLPSDMVAEAGRLLRGSPHQDLRNKALMLFPISKKMDVAKLPAPSELAKKVGNPELGKTLVLTHKDLACSKCHGFQGIGGHIGPDLSMIGIKGSKENLFESLLTPDKAIADQFVQYTIEMKAGVVMTGLVVEETAAHVVLRDANGKDTKLAVTDIENRAKSAKSIMPDNLASFLTEEELVDVVAYLATLKSPALSIDRWQVLGPFKNDAADKGLDDKQGPETGYDAKAQYPGKSGTVTWKPATTLATGGLDPAVLFGSDGTPGVAWLYAEVDVPTAGFGELKLGIDHGVVLYVNGQITYKNRREAKDGPGVDTAAIEWKKGKNTLLVKVSTLVQSKGVSCTVLTAGSEPAKLVR